MKQHISSLCMTICLVLALVTGCSDKSSLEACQYQTTMDLDTGNYDAVLASSCATPMHVAAAYFGKAGYSVTSVINTLISAQTTSANKALQQYMNVLTRKVTPQTLAFLDDSQARYLSIPPSSELYKAAQFDLSIVLAIKSMSLLKSVIDLNGSGSLSTCDINGNAISDDADAATCALLVSGTTLNGGPCPAPLATAATYTTKDIAFTSVSGTYAYKGMTTTITGTASASCPSPAIYKKVFYLNTSDSRYYVATSSGMCPIVGGEMWPCPITSQIDLATAVGASIDGTVAALNTALTGTTAEVRQALEDIKIQACGSLVSTCNATTIANYLQSGL